VRECKRRGREGGGYWRAKLDCTLYAACVSLIKSLLSDQHTPQKHIHSAVPPPPPLRTLSLSNTHTHTHRCMPLLIGFVGERYGWVPPPSYRNHSSLSHPRFDFLRVLPQGLSLTHIELLYAFHWRCGVAGGVGGGGRRGWKHSSFYLRDSTALKYDAGFLARCDEDDARFQVCASVCSMYYVLVCILFYVWVYILYSVWVCSMYYVWVSIKCSIWVCILYNVWVCSMYYVWMCILYSVWVYILYAILCFMYGCVLNILFGYVFCIMYGCVACIMYGCVFCMMCRFVFCVLYGCIFCVLYYVWVWGMYHVCVCSMRVCIVFYAWICNM